MAMKLLLLGKNGQIGWELRRSLAPLGELVALDRDAHDGLCGDLAQTEALAATVRKLRPDVIVNAAGYTAVDKAESESDLARLVNATAPGVLAREAATLGAWLVHYSTDYVFDGTGSVARDEEAPTGPLNVYGRTKLEGEHLIRESGCEHLILRTSWVYSARGSNFARTMLRLASERERLSVIDDQIGAPTGAELLADITALALRDVRKRRGIYHLAALGETSWHGYARHVIEYARGQGQTIRVAPQAIEPVSSSEFKSAARRPLNSRLDTRKLQAAFDLRLTSWQAGVDRMLAEVLH